MHLPVFNFPSGVGGNVSSLGQTERDHSRFMHGISRPLHRWRQELDGDGPISTSRYMSSSGIYHRTQHTQRVATHYGQSSKNVQFLKAQRSAMWACVATTSNRGLSVAHTNLFRQDFLLTFPEPACGSNNLELNSLSLNHAYGYGAHFL